MTAKDYELVADALHRALLFSHPDNRAGVLFVAESFAHRFKRESLRFSYDKFIHRVKFGAPE